MSDKTVTIWTCDRCEAKVETAQGAQPTRWAGLTIVHPPRASRDSNRARTLHLCGECDHDLGSFIDYPRQESADLVQGDAKLRENSGDADATENHNEQELR